MSIVIKNKRNYKGPGVYVGRPSPLGNPFTHIASSSKADVVVESREEAVSRYEDWLREKLNNDTLVRKAFATLVQFYIDFGELTLICWCVPKHKCHAEVLAKMIEEAANAGKTHNEYTEQGKALEA